MKSSNPLCQGLQKQEPLVSLVCVILIREGRLRRGDLQKWVEHAMVFSGGSGCRCPSHVVIVGVASVCHLEMDCVCDLQ